MRDINKTIANVEIPVADQLRCAEWLQLATEAKDPRPDATLDALLKAFKFGFVLGQREERARRKKTA